MMTMGSFKNFRDKLEEQDVKMPLLFLGHGSPMNGIEDNLFSQSWKQLAKDMPAPKAVLVVSAPPLITKRSESPSRSASKKTAPWSS